MKALVKIKIWILWPFQEYFTYIKQIINQRGVAGREGGGG